MTGGRTPRFLVGNALDLLSEGLRDLVDQVLSEEYKTADWHERWAADEAAKRGRPFNCAKEDVQIQLLALTQRKYLFRNRLSNTHLAHASELRDVRNRWAHQQRISMDDALRALDTAERLLRGVGAVTLADEVRSLRLAEGPPLEPLAEPSALVAPVDVGTREVAIQAPLGVNSSDLAPLAEAVETSGDRVAPVEQAIPKASSPRRGSDAESVVVANPPAPDVNMVGEHPRLAHYLPQPSFRFSLATGYELGDVDRFIRRLMSAHGTQAELVALRERAKAVRFHRVQQGGYLPVDVDDYIREALDVINRHLEV